MNFCLLKKGNKQTGILESSGDGLGDPNNKLVKKKNKNNLLRFIKE